MSNNKNNVQTQTSSALHNAIMEAGGKDRPPIVPTDTPTTPGNDGTLEQSREEVMETYATVSVETKKWIDAEAEVIQIILTGIDNDIYSTVDVCPNSMEMWKAIERKFTSRDGASLDSYYLRFYKIMNKLVKNKFEVTNHQVNVQFLIQLKLKWQRFVALVKQREELKTVFYHKLYDILKQHQNEVNEIRAEILAHTANPFALVAQQQPIYYPQPYPTHYTQSSSTRSQAATRNKGKAISYSPPPTYDSEPEVVADDEASSKGRKLTNLWL
ncbi:hypothetical protein Tco_1135200 [Tanacetum coccineum]